MESCKIIFTCNHEFRSIVSEAISLSIIRNTGSNIDKIIDYSAITDITDVYGFDSNNVKLFIKNIDYQLLNHNSIEWISDFKPADGTIYVVEYVISHRIAQSYDIEECPRCDGNGWYAGILPKNQSVTVSNLNKTVQDFIKILFTDKQADTGYGSNFSQLLGKPIASVEDIVTEITAVINDCVVQLQNNQASAMSSGIVLSDSERLLTVDLIDYDYDRVNNGMTMTMNFRNAAGDSAEFTFLL